MVLEKINEKILLVLIIILSNISFIYAVDLCIGLASYQGHTTYQIGGFTSFSEEDQQVILHFPLSELKLPINIYTNEVALSLNFLDRFLFSSTYNFNNNYQDSGKLKDSDWLEQVDQKDIYSESDAKLKLSDLNITLYYLLNKILYSPKSYGLYYFGFMYQNQNLNFIADNLVQQSLSDVDKEPIKISGDVIKYARKSKIPYWVIKSNHYFPGSFNLDTLVLDFTIGFSPWVTINDEDDHLIRKKAGKGSLSGSSFIFNLETDFWFSQKTCFSIGLFYQLLDVMGNQFQDRYEDTNEGQAGHIADVDERLISEYTSIYTNFKFLLNNFNQIYPDFLFNKNEKSILHPEIAFALVMDSQNHYAHPLFSLEQELINNFYLGIAYQQANNKVNNTISKGITTQLPIYAFYAFSLLKKKLYLNFGGGYSWVKNKLDPQAK